MAVFSLTVVIVGHTFHIFARATRVVCMRDLFLCADEKEDSGCA